MVDWQGERTYLSASVRNLTYFVGRLAALCVARLLSTRPPAWLVGEVPDQKHIYKLEWPYQLSTIACTLASLLPLFHNVVCPWKELFKAPAVWRAVKTSLHSNTVCVNSDSWRCSPIGTGKLTVDSPFCRTYRYCSHCRKVHWLFQQLERSSAQAGMPPQTLKNRSNHVATCMCWTL